MNNEDRLKWIDTVSLAIREMSFGQRNALTNVVKINEFAEAIRLMTRVSDDFIKNNKSHFDEIEQKAIVINDSAYEIAKN